MLLSSWTIWVAVAISIVIASLIFMIGFVSVCRRNKDRQTPFTENGQSIFSEGMEDENNGPSG
jgi:hypothetical protein